MNLAVGVVEELFLARGCQPFRVGKRNKSKTQPLQKDSRNRSSLRAAQRFHEGGLGKQTRIKAGLKEQ